MSEDVDERLLRVLRDPLLWKPPALVSREKIAAIFAAVDDEEAAAGALCDGLLVGPPAQWPQRFRATPDTRTLGMVRQLLKRMPALLERRPADALHVTSMAVGIADGVSPQRYPPDHVLLAYGHALRDHAFVLSCLGRHAEALAMITWAGRVFAQLPEGHWDTLLDPGGRMRIVYARVAEAGLLCEGGAVEVRRSVETERVGAERV